MKSKISTISNKGIEVKSALELNLDYGKLYLTDLGNGMEINVENDYDNDSSFIRFEYIHAIQIRDYIDMIIETNKGVK